MKIVNAHVPITPAWFEELIRNQAQAKLPPIIVNRWLALLLTAVALASGIAGHLL